VVITANKSDNELKKHLGGIDGDEATLDRLIEMCRGKIYQVDGQSHRRQGAF
jgi:DNA replication protein DnaC